ncbi:unnamed protein product [Linum trigynum]|uniref:Serine carboxypeptidase n=1 Tax=Linum trigynum TaxID=586398 RepID=A0AAV2FDV2_9ROSI
MQTHQVIMVVITTMAASLFTMPSFIRAESDACQPPLTNEADRISSLPGQPEPVGFGQFSGYIALDDQLQSRLFYYFAEAATNPASKPLVLWLGDQLECSNFGAFSGNGPFSPVCGNVLATNKYTFNQEANIIYLDSPTGTGFSFSANTTTTFATYIYNDTVIATQNMIFLTRWFQKYAEYKNRDFYIAGQGYATGRSVPFLANRILRGSTTNGINLKGIMMGNPLLNFNTDMGSIGDFLWSHGLISDKTHVLMETFCNGAKWLREIYSGSPFSTACKEVDDRLSAEIPDGLDMQDVSSDTCLAIFGLSSRITGGSKFESSKLFSSIRSLTASPSHEEVSEGTDVCVKEKIIKYLNRKDVQGALHARTTNWTACPRPFHYDKRGFETPTVDMVGSLVMKGIRVLIYSIDEVTFVPFLGTRVLVSDLADKVGLNTTVPYRGWFDTDKQVGGWTEAYGEMLTYASIRGGSSKVAKRSLSLLRSFLERKPLPVSKA